MPEVKPAQPNLDVPLSTRASEATLLGIKERTDKIPDNPAREDGNLAKLVGFEIPPYDSILISYIESGNGAGEIGTVVFKKGNQTVATLTLTYDQQNRLISVTKT